MSKGIFFAYADGADLRKSVGGDGALLHQVATQTRKPELFLKLIEEPFDWEPKSIATELLTYEHAGQLRSGNHKPKHLVGDLMTGSRTYTFYNDPFILVETVGMAQVWPTQMIVNEKQALNGISVHDFAIAKSAKINDMVWVRYMFEQIENMARLGRQANFIQHVSDLKFTSLFQDLGYVHIPTLSKKIAKKGLFLKQFALAIPFMAIGALVQGLRGKAES